MADAGGIGIGGAAFGAGSSLIGTLAHNESLRSAGSADVAATKVQYKQIDDQTGLEIQKAANATQGIRARLRVLSADSGLSGGGSFEALDDQATRNQEINDAIIRQNAYNTKLSAGAQLRANLIRLFSGMENPATSTLQGGLAGYGAGIKIGEWAYPNAAPTPGAGGGTEYSGGYGVDPAAGNAGGYGAGGSLA